MYDRIDDATDILVLSTLVSLMTMFFGILAFFLIRGAI
jgi:hypothetical protein